MDEFYGRELNQTRINSILSTVSSLYTSSKLSRQTVAREFTQNPRFEDPLVIVEGKDHVYLQFRSLGSMFHKVEYTVQPDTIQSRPLSEDPVPSYEITFKNKQHYYLREQSNPISLEVSSRIHVEFQDGKWLIGGIYDQWHGMAEYFLKVPGYGLARSLFGSVSSRFIGLFLNKL